MYKQRLYLYLISGVEMLISVCVTVLQHCIAVKDRGNPRDVATSSPGLVPLFFSFFFSLKKNRKEEREEKQKLSHGHGKLSRKRRH